MSNFFGWYARNVQGQWLERWSSVMWLPDLNPPDLGKKINVAAVPTLRGDTLIVNNVKIGNNDKRPAGKFTLTFPVIPGDLRWIIEEDFANSQIVRIRLDHRWKQLQITITETGVDQDDGPYKVYSMAPGYLETNTGNTYWTHYAKTKVVFDSDAYTKLYAKIVTGVDGRATIDLDAGTSVPVDSYLLSNIPLPLLNTSGWSNAKTCQILELTSNSEAGGLDSYVVTLQEVFNIA